MKGPENDKDKVVEDIRKIIEGGYDKRLNRFQLTYKQLNDEDMLKVTDFLKNKNDIEYLNLFSNNITSKGVNYLSPILKNNSKINSIDFGYNQLGVKGINEFVKFLNKNHYIYLSFDRNQLNDEGLKILISHIMKKKIKVDTLRLSSNNITDLSVCSIVKLFDKVKRIELYENAITELGLKKMVNHLAKNKKRTITYIRVEKNKITKCTEIIKRAPSQIEIDCRNQQVEN